MTASCNRPRDGPWLATAVFATLMPLARIASGHDFWIEPETFRPKANSVVKVTLRVGENFSGEEVLRNPEKIAAFVLAGPSAVTANQMQSAGSNLDTTGILGVLAKSPAGLAKITDPGLHVIGYRSNHPAPRIVPAYHRAHGRFWVLESRQLGYARPGRYNPARTCFAATPESFAGRGRRRKSLASLHRSDAGGRCAPDDAGRS